MMNPVNSHSVGSSELGQKSFPTLAITFKNNERIKVIWEVSTDEICPEVVNMDYVQANLIKANSALGSPAQSSELLSGFKRWARTVKPMHENLAGHNWKLINWDYGSYYC